MQIVASGEHPGKIEGGRRMRFLKGKKSERIGLGPSYKLKISTTISGFGRHLAPASRILRAKEGMLKK